MTCVGQCIAFGSPVQLPSRQTRRGSQRNSFNYLTLTLNQVFTIKFNDLHYEDFLSPKRKVSPQNMSNTCPHKRTYRHTHHLVAPHRWESQIYSRVWNISTNVSGSDRASTVLPCCCSLSVTHTHTHTHTNMHTQRHTQTQKMWICTYSCTCNARCLLSMCFNTNTHTFSNPYYTLCLTFSHTHTEQQCGGSGCK